MLGVEDGIPKTPKWASEICGVNVWTIKALADYWAENTVSICPGNMRVPTTYDQFRPMQYPRTGLSTIHMIWSTAPCNVTCWNDGFAFQRAYRDPDIETFVVQHPWMENDCCFADLILPVCTKHEMHDIGNDMTSGVYVSVYKEEPCIERLGESLSDFDVCVKVLEKFGPEYVKAYTGGLTEKERVRFFYKASGCEEKMSFEEWNERKIFVVPINEETKDAPAGFADFERDPEEYPLETPTGLLEYTSTNIEKYMPNDPERPPVPHWVEKGPWHDERLSCRGIMCHLKTEDRNTALRPASAAASVKLIPKPRRTLKVLCRKFWISRLLIKESTPGLWQP